MDGFREMTREHMRSAIQSARASNIHIHTHTHTHIYIYIYIYIFIYMHTHAHIHTHTHARTHLLRLWREAEGLCLPEVVLLEQHEPQLEQGVSGVLCVCARGWR
jgi:hypothetical protein